MPAGGQMESSAQLKPVPVGYAPVFFSHPPITDAAAPARLSGGHRTGYRAIVHNQGQFPHGLATATAAKEAIPTAPDPSRG